MSSYTDVRDLYNRISREAINKCTDLTNTLQENIQRNNLNSPLPAELPLEVEKAAKILKTFTDPEENPERTIPKEVIQNAKGLAIFTVLKAGFVWSGRGGSGIVIARLDDGSWSSPSCINVGGIGVGFQMGADVTDFVVVLNTQEAVEAFSKTGSFTLGRSLSVAAGPMGMATDFSGAIFAQPSLYYYSKLKGFFAGASIEGTIVIERKETNKDFYEQEVSSEQILARKFDVPNDVTKTLYDILKKATSDE